MNKIRIAHLYYDLMNLYGENGNIRVLVKTLEDLGIKVELSNLSIEDKINFDDYDFFYIGTGSEENQLLVLDNLMQYAKDIKNAIEKGKYFFVTGNAVELFGTKINNLDGSSIPCIGAFDYECNITDFRIIGEQVYSSTLLDKKIIGFQNRQTVMKNCSSNLFNVISGTGYEPKVMFEGIHKNNFFGTYLLGPFLVRNPYFLEIIIKGLLVNNKKDLSFNHDDVIYTAYEEYLKNFIEES